MKKNNKRNGNFKGLAVVFALTATGRPVAAARMGGCCR